MIESVSADLPAARANLRAGDIVVAVNGQAVRHAGALRILVSQIIAGSHAEVDIIRDGERKTVSVQLVDPVASVTRADGRGELFPGVSAAPLTDAIREAFRLTPGIRGLVITAVSEDNPFANTLRTGMVVREINGRSISTVAEAHTLLESRPVSRLFIYENGRSSFYAFRQ